jgi:hypothetical protein
MKLVLNFVLKFLFLMNFELTLFKAKLFRLLDLNPVIYYVAEYDFVIYWFIAIIV